MRLLLIALLAFIVSCSPVDPPVISNPAEVGPTVNKPVAEKLVATSPVIASKTKDCYEVGTANISRFGLFNIRPDDTPPNFMCFNHEGTDFIETKKEYSYDDPDGLNWTSPVKEVSDGASIPRIVWVIFGRPFDPVNIRPAIVHDYYYCAHTRSRDDADRAFYYALRTADKGWFTSSLMYAGVRIGAPNKWDDILTNPPRLPCNRAYDYNDSESSLILENLYASNKYTLNLNDSGIAQAIDNINASNFFNDASEPIRRIIAGKYGAIIRTMKTTQGKVLDVVDDKLIFNDNSEKGLLKEFAEETERYFKELREQLRRLVEVRYGPDNRLKNFGLMTIIRPEEIEKYENISPWTEDQIKKSEDLQPLEDYLDINKTDTGSPDKNTKTDLKSFSNQPLLFQYGEINPKEVEGYLEQIPRRLIEVPARK